MKDRPRDLTKVTQLISGKGGSRTQLLSLILLILSVHEIASPDNRRECPVLTVPRSGLFSEPDLPAIFNPVVFNQCLNQNEL